MSADAIARRRIVQPGPVAAERVVSRAGSLQQVTFTLEPGLTLVEAIARPLNRAGLRAAGVALARTRLAPLTYVIPAQSPDADHVAYYSAKMRPTGEIELDAGTATFGSREAVPFIHCHASWREPSDRIRGGHLWPDECIVAVATEATAWGTADVAMLSSHDAETNFTLFHPVGEAQGAGDCIVACIRPGEDLVEAIEALCLRHGIVRAAIRSGIGSIVGVIFDDGRRVEEHPTEFFVTEGLIRPGPDDTARLSMTITLADVRGGMHRGRPARGCNPVLICCELLITIEARRPTHAVSDRLSTAATVLAGS